MTVAQALKYFGTARKVCNALGIAEQNMTLWKNQGYIPMRRQYELEKITNGKLIAKIEDAK